MDMKVENEERLLTSGDKNANSAPPSTSQNARQASYHTPSQLSSPYTATTRHDPTVSDSGGGGGEGASSSSDDDKDDGQEGNSQGEAGGNNKPKMKRTPKQQLQNKQAQQRYRLRRKQKLVEMESALELLTQKVQDMQSIQSQNYYLASRASSLEQSLKAKETEIAKMRQLMAQQHTQDPAGPSSSSVVPPQLDPEEVKKQFVDSVEALKELIQMYDLRNVDVTGVGVPESVMHQCRTLVQHACRQCMQAMTEEQAVVLKVVARDPTTLTPLDAQTDRNRWLAVVRAIRMTDDQVDGVLRVRKEQLRKLRQIYEERIQLSAAASEAFLPSALPPPGAAGGSHPLDKGISHLMQNLQMHGYLYTVLGKIKMSKVMASLKENLQWEQRTIVDFNYMVTNHVLSPIQTALLFVEAFPFHCDVLALANVLALARGESSPVGSDSDDDYSMGAVRDARSMGGLPRGGRSAMSPIPDPGVMRQTSPVNGMGGQMPPMMNPLPHMGLPGGGPKHLMQLSSNMEGARGVEGPHMMQYPPDRPPPGGMMRH